jgi:hypothetical protein
VLGCQGKLEVRLSACKIGGGLSQEPPLQFLLFSDPTSSCPGLLPAQFRIDP